MMPKRIDTCMYSWLETYKILNIKWDRKLDESLEIWVWFHKYWNCYVMHGRENGVWNFLKWIPNCGMIVFYLIVTFQISFHTHNMELIESISTVSEFQMLSYVLNTGDCQDMNFMQNTYNDDIEMFLYDTVWYHRKINKYVWFCTVLFLFQVCVIGTSEHKGKFLLNIHLFVFV